MKNLHERAVEAAIRFVERKGYEVLDRNWSCESVAGRLDLVAMDEDAIVFIDTSPRPTARRAASARGTSPASSSSCWQPLGWRATPPRATSRSASTAST